MLPSAGPPVQFRQLGPNDKGGVARLANAGFDGNEFYMRALGLDARRFELYWHAFFDLILADPSAAVFGLGRNGELQAVLAISFDGFPKTSRAARYLWILLRQLGARALLRYLRFVRRYERAMKLPAGERRLEARGLWLFVKPDAGQKGLGSQLVKLSVEALHARGKLVVTGLFDASNHPLEHFYRRLRFTVMPPFQFAGMQAARIELRLAPLEVKDDAQGHAA